MTRELQIFLRLQHQVHVALQYVQFQNLYNLVVAHVAFGGSINDPEIVDIYNFLVNELGDGIFTFENDQKSIIVKEGDVKK